MIKEWLESYHPVDRDQATAALREIMQEVALAGLYRAAFYEKAAFYGGTALRIFYGLDRFSEDLDFSLQSDDPAFSFHPYIEAIITEFDQDRLKIWSPQYFHDLAGKLKIEHGKENLAIIP